MKNRWQIATSAGVLASVWCGVADLLSLVTWIGFLGCSTYFAQTKIGLKGVLMSWQTNLSGVFWAWLIISASSYFASPYFGYLFTGLATAAMCLQASSKRLSFIPGAFIGCCTTFALNADIAQIIPALMGGALLGYLMTLGTQLLIKLSAQKKMIMLTNIGKSIKKSIA
ncbi:hypothetical protein PCNPT3_06810 [Psychromonas sp. CNPT3]|uniref:DUF1097 domain-containing protein n=1 Tax=Psychromonas sp. CNPT3 TaxID=314282 RepID=UPI00006E2D1E|nr:DUF1097 domain-containing protein [Psychromonas sp. CNPT3]AGH81300.1 hypothetical protein PCNPT3_06810 [Psychromonas sp. CNPT3]